MDELNINWEKRFKDMHVDVTSSVKNFIRLDWTEKSKKAKEYFNKKVDKMIEHITQTQAEYNKLINNFNAADSEYKQNLAKAKKAADEAEKNPNSIQSKILDCRNKLKALKKDIESKKSRLNIPKYTKGMKMSASYTGRLLPYIVSYNSSINLERRYLDECNRNKDRLEHEMKSLQSENNRLYWEIRELEGKESSDPEKWRQLQPLKSKQEENKQKISELRQKINTLKQNISNSEFRLKKIDSEIHQFNENQFANAFGEITSFTKTSLLKINEKYSYLNSFQKANVKEKAAEAGIATSRTINRLEEKISKLSKEFKTIENFAEIKDKKYYDSGLFKGFFTFLSTKENVISEIENKITEIDKKIKEASENIPILKDKIKKFSTPNYDDKKNISASEDNIPKSIKKINEIQSYADKFMIEFNKRFSRLLMPILLKPTYDKHGLIYDVSEGTIRV